jgi:hypothetical protein
MLELPPPPRVLCLSSRPPRKLMMLMDASPGTPPGMGWMREENRSDEKE